MRFRCHKNGSEAKNFTDQKIYEAVSTQGFGFIILDDNGCHKFVGTDGGKSGHLWKGFGRKQKSVGWFQSIYYESDQNCPKSKDGETHCVDWWDGGKCCWCEDEDNKEPSPYSGR